jgi:hypothetical protein
MLLLKVKIERLSIRYFQSSNLDPEIGNPDRMFITRVVFLSPSREDPE